MSVSMNDDKRVSAMLLELFKEKLRKELVNEAIKHMEAEVKEAAKRIVDELEPAVRSHLANGWETQLIVQLAIKEPGNGNHRV